MPLVTSSGLAHVRLTVTDIARSKAFYDQVFGWPVAIDASGSVGEPGVKDSPESFYGGCVYQTPQGTLFGLRPVGSTSFDSEHTGLDHISFAVASRDELVSAEAALTGAGDGRAVLVLGFESAHHPVDAQLELALQCARDHGGEAAVAEPAASGGRQAGGGDSVGAWRNAFLQAPYLRDTFVASGVLSETFETAITWDRFAGFHAEVMATARLAAAAASGAPIDGPGVPRVSCRFTHVYPDGPAPYFTILAPARRGDEVQQWAEVKVAVSEALIAAGGTITHHHAVGRDHRPWYDRQRPPAFAEALRAAKRALDPAAVLNPGVLIDP
ncbi:MAG: alkyldihydroxyacetonephosphate synthase [Solirubrobacterales bacterium]|nr:alkyldihydroxyacetonephosphate synthase [Solirubrobacterales bacterium]